MFIGSRHCQRCGAAAASVAAAALPPRSCPRCRIEMQSVAIGETAVRECLKCEGLWLDVASFEKICADREQQSAVLGAALPAPARQLPASAESEKIHYAPCPHCGQLMNRINFARCSGVIVDVCKGHGTWFDRDELSGIIQFIRGGGLDIARQKEKQAIEFERQQLRTEQMIAANRESGSILSYSDEERLGGITAAGGLLKFLLE